jgi:hypothetical protein
VYRAAAGCVSVSAVGAEHSAATNSCSGPRPPAWRASCHPNATGASVRFPIGSLQFKRGFKGSLNIISRGVSIGSISTWLSHGARTGVSASRSESSPLNHCSCDAGCDLRFTPAHQRECLAVVLPAWDGCKSGTSRRKTGDQGQYSSLSGTGNGRAPAGTTKGFQTALLRMPTGRISERGERRRGSWWHIPQPRSSTSHYFVHLLHPTATARPCLGTRSGAC